MSDVNTDDAIGTLARETLEELPEAARESLRLLIVAEMQWAILAARRNTLHVVWSKASAELDVAEAKANEALVTVEICTKELSKALDPSTEEADDEETDSGEA